MDLVRLRALQGAARRARGDAEASAMRLSDEPPHPPLTPDGARAVIAAVRRLAHAGLGLHALVAARRDGDQPGEETARRLDALAAALDATMSQLALSLRTLDPPGPTTALRPLQAELRDGPVIDPRLVGVTDGLVSAIDAIAAILRNHIGSRANVPTRLASNQPSRQRPRAVGGDIRDRATALV